MRFFKNLLILLVLINSPAADAGFVHYANDVKGQGAVSGGVLVLTPAATSAGHLLILGVSWCCNATTPTITNNTADVWSTTGAKPNDGIGDYSAIYYINNATAGLNHISITPGDYSIAAAFAEFSSANLTTPLDASNSATPAGVKIGDSGAVTPHQPGNLLVINSLDDNDGNPGTPGTGFTAITTGYGGTASTNSLNLAYQIYNTTAAVHGIVNFAVNGTLPTIIYAFRPYVIPPIRHKVKSN